jgi:hypothetical protein
MPSQLGAYPGFAPPALDSPFPNAGLNLTTFPAASRQIQFALKLLF